MTEPVHTCVEGIFPCAVCGQAALHAESEHCAGINALRTAALEADREPDPAVARSTGEMLDRIATLYGLARVAGETDGELRARCQVVSRGFALGNTFRFPAVTP